MTRAQSTKRKPTAIMRAMSLVQSYFATFPSKQDALDALNTALGTAYTHSTLSRWMRNEKSPNHYARAVMMHRVLPGVLKAHGKGTAADVGAALDKLL